MKDNNDAKEDGVKAQKRPEGQIAKRWWDYPDGPFGSGGRRLVAITLNSSAGEDYREASARTTVHFCLKA